MGNLLLCCNSPGQSRGFDAAKDFNGSKEDMEYFHSSLKRKSIIKPIKLRRPSSKMNDKVGLGEIVRDKI